MTPEIMKSMLAAVRTLVRSLRVQERNDAIWAAVLEERTESRDGQETPSAMPSVPWTMRVKEKGGQKNFPNSSSATGWIVMHF